MSFNANSTPGISSLGLVNQNTGAGAALSSLDASGKGFLVGGPVGAVAAGVASLVASWAQHTKRLRDAKNENAALDALIPAFDADLQDVVNAFNSGVSPQDCINQLIQIDSYAYSYLRAQLGQPNTPGLPGVAWGGPSSSQLGYGLNPSYPATCDAKCTAGCCVYLNDLRPAIFGRTVGSAYSAYQTRAGVVGGLIEAIQNGGGMVHVIPIAPPPNKAYGNYARATYDLTLTKPSSVTGIAESVLGVTSTSPTASVQTGQSNVPFISSLSKVSLTVVFAVVGGLILVITALFGQNALRVNR